MTTTKIELPKPPALSGYSMIDLSTYKTLSFSGNRCLGNKEAKIEAALAELYNWYEQQEDHGTGDDEDWDKYHAECRAYIGACVDMLVACFPSQGPKQAKIYKAVLADDLIIFTPDIVKEAMVEIRRTEGKFPSTGFIFQTAQRICDDREQRHEYVIDASNEIKKCKRLKAEEEDRLDLQYAQAWSDAEKEWLEREEERKKQEAEDNYEF
jgi:hypothetical protein